MGTFLRLNGGNGEDKSSVVRSLKSELEKKAEMIEGVINSPLNLRIPEIKEVRQTAEQGAIDRAVIAARNYIAKIPAHMGDLVKRINAIRSAPPEERAIRAKERKELEGEIISHLNNADGIAGAAAKHAYIMATLATLPADKDAILAAINGQSPLPGLKELGALHEVESGRKAAATTVKAFGKSYAVNGGRAIEIADKLRELVGEAYGTEIEAMKNRATISIGDGVAGKGGRFFINVPDGKDGDRFLPGGVILAQSDGKVVRGLEFLGHFQKVMNEVAKAKTFITIQSLREERLQIFKKVSPETFRLCRIFHSILRRGIQAAQADEGTKKIEEEMLAARAADTVQVVVL